MKRKMNSPLKLRKVKRSESGMIQDPVTLSEKANVGEALNLMAEFKIGGIPIIDEAGTLKGIVTNRDLRFEKQRDKKITEVMTSGNLVTALNEISLLKAEKILQEHKIEKLLIVDKSYKLNTQGKSLFLEQ
jgi:IMP dehydrogenase